MIKAVCDVNGRTVVLLGLDPENIRRLQDDKPIRFEANTLGVGDFTVAIAVGTREDITAQMATAGLFDRVMAVPEDTTGVMQPAGEHDPIDVREIVAEVVGANRAAKEAYLHDPAMKYGIEVVIGTLGWTVDTLVRTGRHTRAELVDLVRTIAIACSISGGPADEQTIGQANTDLFPDRDLPTGDLRTSLVISAMSPDLRNPATPTGLTPRGSKALTQALVAEGFEIVDGPARV